MKIVATALACSALLGCGEKAAEPAVGAQVSAASASAPPTRPAFTGKEWRAAYLASSEIKPGKANEDGVTEYTSCFDRVDEKKCGAFFFGKQDGFKKIDYLTPAYSQLNAIGDFNTYTSIYIAARECSAPSILMSPIVNQRGGWLFMRKASYMADGVVVLEHDFEHADVNRDTGDRGYIHERGTWIASPADIDALRTLSKAASTITRFTGDTSYLTVGKDRQKEFVDDVQDVLKAYDKLTEALQQAGGPNCTP